MIFSFILFVLTGWNFLQEETNGELESDDTFVEDAFDAKKPMHYFAVPALMLLAELLAPVLDIIYPSGEKDKVRADWSEAACSSATSVTT